MKIRGIVTVVVVLLILGGAVWTLANAAFPPMSLQGEFAGANKLYREGKYKEAAQAYERILSEGTVSFSLFYNLGNSYVKTGQIARAIVSYERALREDPRDPEARANLEYARGLLSDRIDDTALSLLLGRLSPAQWFSWRENVWGFVMFYWVGALLGIVAVFLYRRVRWLSRAALALLGVALILGLLLYLRGPLWSHPQAIVMNKEVEVRYGPVMGESTAFTLHEGAKVKVLRSSDGWDQILFSKGKVGWVSADALEKI